MGLAHQTEDGVHTSFPLIKPVVDIKEAMRFGVL